MYGYSLERLQTDAALYASRFLAFFREPSTFLQIVVVAVCFLAAWGLGRLTHDPVEGATRRIRGAPRFPRTVAAPLRRMRLVFFVPLLWGSVRMVEASEGVEPSLSAHPMKDDR